MTNLLEIARALSPQQRAEAYEKQMRPGGDAQFADAIALADPTVKLHHADLHPQPGVLLRHVSTDGAGRRITRFHGDARVWRSQFDAPPMAFSITDTRRRGV